LCRRQCTKQRRRRSWKKTKRTVYSKTRPCEGGIRSIVYG
jgi:hypothetical protein